MLFTFEKDFVKTERMNENIMYLTVISLKRHKRNLNKHFVPLSKINVYTFTVHGTRLENNI